MDISTSPASRFFSKPNPVFVGTLLVAAAAGLASIALISANTGNVQTGGAGRVSMRVPFIENPLQLKVAQSEQAVLINQQRPVSQQPNPPALPFLPIRDPLAQSRAVDCLTSAIYFEAAGEGPDGQRAVAQVVLNRVRHPAFPKRVCEVVFQGSMRETGCQFSFTCDGAMRRQPMPALWRQSKIIAEDAIKGFVFLPVGNATHYHANYVVPCWAPSLVKTAAIGLHIFYRWQGWWGTRGAFRGRYSGDEPDPARLRNAALRTYSAITRPPAPAASVDGVLVTTDPRVELISVVEYLAARIEVSDVSSAYQKAVHKHFDRYADMKAVQLYRDLQIAKPELTSDFAAMTLMHFSPSPQLEVISPLPEEMTAAFSSEEKLRKFVSALRRFAKISRFDAFYQKNTLAYKAMEAAERGPALTFFDGLKPAEQKEFRGLNYVLAPLLGIIENSRCKIPPETTVHRILVATGQRGEPLFPAMGNTDKPEASSVPLDCATPPELTPLGVSQSSVTPEKAGAL